MWHDRPVFGASESHCVFAVWVTAASKKLAAASVPDDKRLAALVAVQPGFDAGEVEFDFPLSVAFGEFQCGGKWSAVATLESVQRADAFVAQQCFKFAARQQAAGHCLPDGKVALLAGAGIGFEPLNQFCSAVGALTEWRGIWYLLVKGKLACFLNDGRGQRPDISHEF
ncbi:MAG: hypothetical protein N3I86_13940, partial [Verrucomicrobiae bacterium]|nr:hypothetical protein [Verrucomicrobiae bacterium]